MQNKKINLIKMIKSPKVLLSLIAVCGLSFSVSAFTGPPPACTPDSCSSPLTVDFSTQTVSLSTSPTANNHAATKEYVDTQVAALNTTPKYYQTPGTYNGSNADTACDSGYHMCFPYEWYGRIVDFSKNSTGTFDGYSWYDANSNTTSSSFGDCANWTTTLSSSFGQSVRALVGNNYGWQYSTRDCSSLNYVLCCSD